MIVSPPTSPTGANGNYRPMSMLAKPRDRSGSRMSLGSRNGTGSRASDEDTRTAVRVAVRVRPPLRPTDANYDLIPPRFQRNIVNVTTPTSLVVESPQGKKVFLFDRVFPEETDQRGIWEYVSDSVDSFIQGYNVSILAYGQSGAGKSHTMGTSGPGDYETESLGIIPRAAQALFERLDGTTTNLGSQAIVHARNSSTGLKTPNRYSMSTATYVEIYNEQLRDLLIPETIPQGERPAVTIREDTKGRIILTGLRSVEINSIDDLLSALDFGSSIRQTDATALNAQSSRSHAVFSLNLIMRHGGGGAPNNMLSKAEKRMSMPADLSGAGNADGGGVTINSKLHFVDLAGSERMKHTGASGERAKEGISINAGLASLGKVISQLSTRNPGAYVSYRDSKLTRLLQDSLGGNAITYMIACVTPVEFHLNETLNTVQYAQRARAIQSKPHIQQVADEGDKLAVIDRLKAEIAFLREQIKSARDSANDAEVEVARKNNGTPDTDRANGTTSRNRGDRQTEKEKELQNALLDVQESYEALSTRHAKLIAEMSKASGSSSDLDPEGAETLLGASAMDRLKRSHSFAESVEQVVLEYEKTLQSLETSLSQTRSSLATVESNLLERETKCAYVETINSQLQARIQKMADREANTEHYLQGLEAKLDGQASGEEQHSALVTTLRKELARARENEASCEDYISTLEERLAESDQDTELMQREIERLEQVVERQRSLGKLDGLLSDFDQKGHSREFSRASVRSKIGTSADRPTDYTDSDDKPVLILGHDQLVSRTRTPSEASSARGTVTTGEPLSIVEEEIPDGEDHEVQNAQPAPHSRGGGRSSPTSRSISGTSSIREQQTAQEYDTYIAAQSQLVVQQLAAVSQELADLKSSHETKVSEYERLNLKYREALRNIAELQGKVDETRQKRQTQLSETALKSLSRVSTKSHGSIDGAPPSHSSAEPSRPLEAELESAIPVSGIRTETGSTISDTEASFRDARGTRSTTSQSRYSSGSKLGSGSDNMQRLMNDHRHGMARITHQYEQLQSEHDQTLRLVEQLKADLIISRQDLASISGSSGSPTRTSTPRGVTPGHTPASSFSQKPKVVRRVTSQSLTNTDRAHRFLASLRNVAAEEFECRPDSLASFEHNLNAAMHELHIRMERIEELEHENQTVKKEVEAKATIIAGLTRERTSLSAAAPQVDLSFVGQLHEQIEAYQAKIQEMETSHDSSIKKLADEVSSLKQLMKAQSAELQQRDETIITLEQESRRWQDKHNVIANSLEETEKKLQSTLTQLESALAGRMDMENKHSSTSSELDNHANLLEAANAELEEARAQCKQLETKHAHASSSLDDHQTQLQSTLGELDVALQKVTALEKERDALANSDIAVERARHADEISAINRETEEHKQTIEEHRHVIDDHMKTIDQLEDALEEAKKKAATHEKSGINNNNEVEGLRRQIKTLNAEIDTCKATVEQREMELGNMQAIHSQELEALEEKLVEADKAHNRSMNEKTANHEKELKSLRAEIEQSKSEVQSLVDKVSHLLEMEIPDVPFLYQQIERTVKEKEQLSKELSDLVDTNEDLMRQLASKELLDKQIQELTSKASTHEGKAQELAFLVATHEEAMHDMEAALQKKDKLISRIEAEKEKSARLVEELEEQISSSFDDHNNRLSVIKEERVKAIDEANARIVTLEKDVESYRSRLSLMESQLRDANYGHDRTNSTASN
ncbi:Nucleoporin nup84, partial [Ascosphaera pollenicola]